MKNIHTLHNFTLSTHTLRTKRKKTDTSIASTTLTALLLALTACTNNINIPPITPPKNNDNTKEAVLPELDSRVKATSNFEDNLVTYAFSGEITNIDLDKIWIETPDVDSLQRKGQWVTSHFNATLNVTTLNFRLDNIPKSDALQLHIEKNAFTYSQGHTNLARVFDNTLDTKAPEIKSTNTPSVIDNHHLSLDLGETGINVVDAEKISLVDANGKDIGDFTVKVENGKLVFETTAELTNQKYGVSIKKGALKDSSDNIQDQDFFSFDGKIKPSPPLSLTLVGENEGYASSLTPTVKVQASPNVHINLYNAQGKIVGTGTTGNDGFAQITLSHTLTQGAQSLTAKAFLSEGFESETSQKLVFTVDTEAPQIPTAVSLDGKVQGHYTNREKPLFNIIGTEGDTVIITDSKGNTLGEATIDDTHVANISLATPLDENTYTFFFSTRDKAGNESQKSSPYIVNVDFTPPEAPQNPKLLNTKDNMTTNIQKPTITLQTEAGNLVIITNAQGDIVGEGYANEEGIATINILESLSEGMQTLTAKTKDKSDNESLTSTDFSVNIDVAPPNAPENLTLIGDATPFLSFKSQPQFQVKAEPENLVTLFDDKGTKIGEGFANAQGLATITSTDPLTNGIHILRAQATDKAGNTGEKGQILAITIDTTPPRAPSEPMLLNGTTSSDSKEKKPLFSISTEAFAKVEIVNNLDQVLGTAYANAQGVATIELISELADGEHTFAAQTTDRAGNTSEKSSNVTITIDTTPPEIPSLFTLEGGGGSSTDPTPTFSLKAQPLSLLTITDKNGSVIAEGQADAEGLATLTLTKPLEDGEHTLTLKATDAVGLTSEGVSTTFSLDTSTLTNPHSLQIRDGATPTLTNDTTPTITLKAPAYTKVAVYNEEGEKIAETTTDANGNASLTLPSLDNGSHSILAKTLNSSGIVTSTSEPFLFTLDTTPPLSPASILLWENSDPNTTSDTQPTIAIIATPGTKIELYNGTTLLGTATANKEGRALITPTTPLTEGQHNLTAFAIDTAGNKSPASDPLIVNIDTTPIATPSTPVFINVDDHNTTRDNTPTISVSSEKGALIEILNSENNVIASTFANDQGIAILTLNITLNDGSHALRARAKDKAGNISAESAVATLTVDTENPNAPSTISLPSSSSTTNTTKPTFQIKAEANATVRLYNAQGQEIGSATADADGSATVSVSVPFLEGSHSITASSTDIAGNESVKSDPFTFKVAIEDNDAIHSFSLVESATPTLTNIPKPTFKAFAPADTQVGLFSGSTLIGKATAASDGTLTLAPTQDLIEGDHTLSLKKINENDEPLGSGTSLSFTLDTTPPEKPASLSLTDGITGTLVANPSPQFNVTAKKGDTITLLDSDNKILLEVIAEKDGLQSVTLSQPLSDGNHSISVLIKDKAGNISPQSNPFAFTLDTIAPNIPSNIKLTESNNGITNNHNPSLTVSGDIGSTIRIYDQSGKWLGEGVVGTNGQATITTSYLAEGTHTLKARALDDSQNISDDSGAVSIIVDTLPPSAPPQPTVKDGATSSLTNDTTPTITTRTKAGNTVIFADKNGTTLAEVVANEDGIASFTFQNILNDGEHTVSAHVIDPVGNKSETSPILSLTVDSTPPDIPTSFSLKETTDSNLINNNKPTFIIKASPLTKIVIFNRDGDKVHEITTDKNGQASFQFSDPINEGYHTYSIKAIDDALNLSTDGQTLSFSIDTTPPVSPSSIKMFGGINGFQTSSSTPTFRVQTDANARVELFANTTTKIGEATADENGLATISLSSPLQDGAYNITATSQDIAGNKSEASTPLAIEIDSTAPLKPSSLTFENFSDPSFINDNTPTIFVHAEAGAVVRLFHNGRLFTSSTASEKGIATFENFNSFQDGMHTFTAQAFDAVNNASPFSDEVNITIDTLAPQTPSTPALKTGGSLTNDTTPTLIANAEAGATITLHDTNNIELGRAVTGQNGVVEITPSSALAQGEHTFTIIVRDDAGNQSITSSPFTFTLDSITPEKPSAIALVGGATSHLINNASPSLTVRAEAGTTLELLSIDNNIITSGTVGNNGTLTLSFPTPLLNGEHTVRARTTDSVGNISDLSDNFVFRIDTLAPVIPHNFKLSGGSSETLTNSKTPSFTVNAEAGATVTLYEGSNVLATALVNNEGLATLTISSALGEGEHSLTVNVRDEAGNVSAKTDALTISIDLSAPATPSTFTMIDSATATLHNDNTPSFSVTATPDTHVKIYDASDNLIGDATTDSTGTATITLSSSLNDGEHVLNLFSEDNAGNISATSLVLTITIDTAAPNIPGAVSFQNEHTLSTSNSSQPKLTATADVGTTVIFYADSNEIGRGTVGPEGSVTVTSTTLIDGPYTLTAVSQDKAGNKSSPSTNLKITIDTTPPLAPTEFRLIEGGTSQDTKTTKPKFLMKITSAGRITITDVNDKILFHMTAAQPGEFLATLTEPLSEGSHQIKATLSDFFGNESEATTPININVDLTVPASPTELTLTDGFTSNISAIANPTLSVKAEAESLVRIYKNGIVIASGNANTSGIALITLESLGDGNHDIIARTFDAAGNESSASAIFTITIDTVDPSKPTSLTLVGGVDASNTNDDTPLFSVSAEANSTVKLYHGETLIDEAVADNNGLASLEASSPLNDGNYTLTATTTDSAGNVSEASDTLSISIDTSSSDKPTALTLLNSATATLTNDNTPSLTVHSDAGNTIRLYNADNQLLASAVTAADGIATLTLSNVLGEGEHTLSAESVDRAGNISPRSTPLTITVDTTAPAIPSLPALSSDETLTNNNTPSFIVTTNAGNTVTLWDSSDNVIATAIANEEGIASLTPDSPLSDGNISLKTTTSDKAGNNSSASNLVVFTIDTTNPSAPTNLALVGGATASLTNSNTPTFSLKAERGTNVQILSGGNVIGEATADTSGNASVTISTPLSDTSYNLTARAVDEAGNIGLESPALTITIDSTAPNKPSAPAFTSLIPNLDFNLTNTLTPNTIAITAETGLTANLYDTNDNLVATGSGGPLINLLYANPLSEGSHSFKLQLVDAAGNVSTFSDFTTIVVDTTAPTKPSGLTIQGDNSPLFINDKTPTFSVQAEAGSLVTFFVNNVDVGSVNADENGLATLISSELADGNFTLKASAKDQATNTSEDSDILTISLDTAIPNTPTNLTLLGGTTSSLTRETNVSISVTSEANHTVFLYDNDNNLVGSADTDEDGVATISLSSLDNGSHSFTAEVHDKSDNISPRSTAITFTVDSIPPSTPQGLSLEGGTNITNDTTPTFVVNAEVGVTVEILDSGNNVVASAVTGTDGTASLTPSSPLDPQEHTLTAVTIDAAGNRSQSSDNFTFTIDTTNPSAPTNLALSGDHNNNFTRDNTPSFSVNAESLSTVFIVDGNDNIIGSAVADNTGLATITPSQALADGDITLHAYAEDQAQNRSALSSTIAITIDTVTPSQPQNVTMIGTYSATASSDNTPQLSVEAEVGALVTFFSGTDIIGSATADANGKATITSSLLADGNHTLTAKAQDTAGNESIVSNALTILIDIITPLKPSAITLKGGTTATLTNDNTPSLTLSTEAGATVKIFLSDNTLIGEATAGQDGNVSITSSELTDGNYTLHALVTDSAGNESEASDTLSFIVDTTISIRNVRVFDQVELPDDDTLYTNANTGPFYIDWPDLGSTVTLSINGTVIGTATHTNTEENTLAISTSTITDGSHVLTISATDEAGNTLVLTRDITIDSTPPTLPSNIQVVGLSGSYLNTDTFVLSAQTDPGATISFYQNGTLLLGEAVADSDGNATATVSDREDGDYTISARATDSFGNISHSTQNTTFTLDTTPPSTPSLSIENGENFTNQSTASLNFSGDLGTTLFIEIFDGNTFVALQESPLDSEGNFTLDLSFTEEETLSYRARLQDEAGNFGNYSNSFNVTYDITSPLEPSAPVFKDDASLDTSTEKNTQSIFVKTEAYATVAIYHNNGHILGEKIDEVVTGENGEALISTSLTSGEYEIIAISTDRAGNARTSNASNLTVYRDSIVSNVNFTSMAVKNGILFTKDSTPSTTFTLSENATVTITLNGTQSTLNASAGNFTHKFSNLTLNTTNALTVEIVDSNNNTITFTRNVYLDNQAPTVSTPILLEGITSTLTNKSTQTLLVNTEAGASVSLYGANGVLLASGFIADENGIAILTPSLYSISSGSVSHAVKVKATDIFGNASGFSSNFFFTIDLTRKTAELSVQDTVTQPGNSDLITNESNPTVLINAVQGHQISLSLDGNVIATFTASSSNFSQALGTLSSGSHSLSLTTTDSNNQSVTIDYTLVYDNQAPAQPTLVMQGGATATLTKDNTPEFLVTGEAGATALLYQNGTLIAEGPILNNSQALLSPEIDISDGTYNFTAKVRDLVGNISTESSTLTSTIDTLIPGTLKPITGGSQSDIFYISAAKVSRSFYLRGGEDNLHVVLHTTQQSSGVKSIFYDGTASYDSNKNNSYFNAGFSSSNRPDEGFYSFHAVATDPAGNTFVTETITVKYDYTAPIKPTFTVNISGNITNDNTPSITVNGEAHTRFFFRATDSEGRGVDIRVFQGFYGDNDVITKSAHPSQPFSDGTYDLDVRLRDHAGNYGPWSDQIFNITIDTVAPDAPTSFTLTSGGTSTTDTTPTFSIKGEAYGLVKILDENNNIIGEATASVNGSVKFSPTTPLAAGETHNLTARIDDVAGNMGTPSSTLAITITTPSLHDNNNDLSLYEPIDSLFGISDSSPHADFGV